jgi:hypothetical protein
VQVEDTEVWLMDSQRSRLLDEELELGPEELALHRIASGDEPYEPLTPEDVVRAELMAFELDRPAE